ncbi:MAG: hypothetical protein HKN30_03840 [Sulfitobacter sp.]|nr:hypothetical protein [Sulfitobacter sp.]
MSAPDTNIEKQEEKHKHALLGIRGALVFGFAMLLLIVAFSVMRGSEPTADTVIGTEGAQETSDGVNVDPVTPGTNVSN